MPDTERPNEPDINRTVSFFDGENLYRHTKEAFGQGHPNYYPTKLSDAICTVHGWKSHGVRFYWPLPPFASKADTRDSSSSPLPHSMIQSATWSKASLAANSLSTSDSRSPVSASNLSAV